MNKYVTLKCIFVQGIAVTIKNKITQTFIVKGGLWQAHPESAHRTKCGPWSNSRRSDASVIKSVICGPPSLLSTIEILYVYNEQRKAKQNEHKIQMNLNTKNYKK